MQLNPYLNFNGQCEEAFKFYEQVLGGKIEYLMTHGNSPMAAHVPAEWHSKVLHAHFRVGDQAFMGCDAPPEHYKKPQGFSVTINVDTPAQADETFHALAEGGTIQMLIQETFWAARFGMLVDRFGIPWMVNCAKQS